MPAAGSSTTTFIQSMAGYVLVDTGYAGAFPRFLKRLRRAGIDARAISYVFLTHAHDDHAGFLNEALRAAPRAKVVAHSAALAGLRRGQNSFAGGCTSRLALGFCRLMKLLGHGEHRLSASGSIAGRTVCSCHGGKTGKRWKLPWADAFWKRPGIRRTPVSLLLPRR